MKRGFIAILMALCLCTALAAPALGAAGNTSGPWGVDISPQAGFANLSTAKRNQATAGKTMVVSTVMNCGNLTISADRTLEVKQGGRIRYSGNLVIKGPVVAGGYQIFEKVGNGTLTLDARAVPWVYPAWWGAKGDGTTDDTEEYNSALSAGPPVWAPRSSASYVIDGATSVVFKSGSKLFSDGAVFKLKPGTYASAGTMFTTAPGQNGSYNPGLPVVSDVVIKGIVIDGNIANVIGSCTGINFYKVFNGKVLDCTIQNLPGTAGSGYGVIFNYSNQVWIERSWIDRTDRQNVAVWETQGAHITGCTLNFSYLRDNILVSSNTLTDDGGVTYHPSYQLSHAIISNTKCTNTSSDGTHAIRFSGGGSGTVENCTIVSASNVQAIYITDVMPQTVFIRGCTISGGSYGVEVASDHPDKYVSIADCKILGCVNGIKYNASGTVIVEGNSIIGSSGQPLLVAYAKDKVIKGNLISGGSLYVHVRAESGGTTLFEGNTVRGLVHETYAVYVIGDEDSKPRIANNVVEHNTADVIWIATAGRAVGNSPGVVVTTTAITDQLLTGTVNPSFAPLDSGLTYYNSATGKFFKSKGTAEAGDWVLIN